MTSLVVLLRTTADRVVGWSYKGDANPDPRLLMQQAADRIERFDWGLSELLSVSERSRSGDPSLDPEEWYAIRDYCRILVDEVEWVAWGYANLTTDEADRRRQATNADRAARGDKLLTVAPKPSDGPDYHADLAFWKERSRG